MDSRLDDNNLLLEMEQTTEQLRLIAEDLHAINASLSTMANCAQLLKEPPNLVQTLRVIADRILRIGK
jgi:hypothetical protein